MWKPNKLKSETERLLSESRAAIEVSGILYLITLIENERSSS
jgi:hypothetical protein